jgi:rhamnulokinase
VEGLRRAAETHGNDIVSVGIDSWGCDFGLLDESGRLLDMPHQYRDPRFEGMREVLNSHLGEVEVFAHTGVRTLFYNTSLHLLAEASKNSPALANAKRLLFIPDLLAYWLTGIQANEQTIASTSQLLDPRSRDWAWKVIEAINLPTLPFGRVVPPGTVLGPVRPEVAEQIGIRHLPVISTASHDTAAAVAGIPLEGDDKLWLSSGTWSIMGLELPGPITSPAAYEFGFGNELGVAGTVRFLCNISGLWIILECRRAWALQGEKLSYDEMDDLASKAEQFTAFIDPDDPTFASAGGMPEKILAYCARTGQSVPEDKGTLLRVAIDSLALKYRHVYERLCKLVGKRYTRLNVGGGGIQNVLLSQATADALAIEVVAGPVEATSCGNIITQMIAMGEIPDLAAGRRLIRESFEFRTFRPENTAKWDAAYQRFCEVIGK